MDREEEIRQIAYRIWEEEGCPHGRDLEHFLMAEGIWRERHPEGPAVTDSPPTRPNARARRRSSPRTR